MKSERRENIRVLRDTKTQSRFDLKQEMNTDELQDH